MDSMRHSKGNGLGVASSNRKHSLMRSSLYRTSSTCRTLQDHMIAQLLTQIVHSKSNTRMRMPLVGFSDADCNPRCQYNSGNDLYGHVK